MELSLTRQWNVDNDDDDDDDDDYNYDDDDDRKKRREALSAVIWKLSLTPKYQGMPAQGASVIHSHHSQIQIYKYNTNT